MESVVTAHSRRLSNAALVHLSAALAAGLCLLHWSMVDYPERLFQLSWHNAIIANQGPYPEQYRFLSFFLAEGLMRLGLPFDWAHAALRWLFTSASLFVFYRYLTAWFDPLVALLGYFMFAAVLPFTYLFYGMQVTDPLNMLVFLLAFWAIRDGKDAWLFPLVVLGMLNRETVLMIPLLYACVRFDQTSPRRWLWRAAVLAIIAAAIYAGLRFVFGLKAPYAPSGLGAVSGFWHRNAARWTGWVQALAFFNLALLYAWRHLERRPVFLRRALLLVPPFLAIHLSVGNLREIRLFLPLLPVLIPLTLMELTQSHTDELAGTVRKGESSMAG